MNTDQVLQLQQPVVTNDAIRAVNFFNGRLLTGNDLSRQQQARRQADRLLGLALGDGVAFGLDVAEDSALSTAAAPVLRITAGLALNRLGQTLRLDTDTSIALSRRFDAVGADLLFDQCNPIAGGTYVAGAGVYVLTIAPAELGEGRASSNGLDPAMVRCNTDATVEALQFRLLTIDPRHYTDLDLGSAQLRNRIVYRCFGIPEDDTRLAAPLAGDHGPVGLLATLDDEGLTPSDVPLALLFWTGDGLWFIDTWAVRRPLHAARDQADPPLGNQHPRRAVIEAICAQFTRHIADLIAGSSNPAGIVARTHFRFLPPFGLVPLQGGNRIGVNELGFFDGLVHSPRPWSPGRRLFIDARQLDSLRTLALDQRPVDTAQPELIRVYRPWQNLVASAADPSIQPVALFTGGLLPDLARPRFDLARADYSNLANCCDAS